LSDNQKNVASGAVLIWPKRYAAFPAIISPIRDGQLVRLGSTGFYAVPHSTEIIIIIMYFIKFCQNAESTIFEKYVSMRDE